jgi:ribosomal protein S18 acetylase RimI-like enzyme
VPNEAEWTIERLSGKHDRELFSCGVESLDNFLRFLASQYEQRNIGRTWVAVEPGQPRVIGYYTLSNGALQPSDLPPPLQKKLPRNLPIPIMHLGRLAVDSSRKGRGLGEFLLLDALHRTWRQSKQVGIHAVEVRAIDTHAQSFYTRYGFSSLIDDPLHMYLPVRSLRDLFPEA